MKIHESHGFLGALVADPRAYDLLPALDVDDRHRRDRAVLGRLAGHRDAWEEPALRGQRRHPVLVRGPAKIHATWT